MSIKGAPGMAATVVAVDVGKNTAVLSVTDAARHRLLGPVELADMTEEDIDSIFAQTALTAEAYHTASGICGRGEHHIWRAPPSAAASQAKPPRLDPLRDDDGGR